jgi:excisionase family DNA binding protein
MTAAEDTSAALTTAQAAARLGVAPNSVMNWVDAGLLSAWRTPGGHRRISASSVQAMIEERRRQATEAQTSELAVMVVEDNPDTAAVLSAQLSQILPSARVRVVNDGFQALLEAGREAPDLMLTDINLPGMNGIAMIHRLRKEPATREMGFVLVSNYRRHELAPFGEPPVDVPLLNKPIATAALREAIALVLTQRQRAMP